MVCERQFFILVAASGLGQGVGQEYDPEHKSVREHGLVHELLQDRAHVLDEPQHRDPAQRSTAFVAVVRRVM